MTDPQNPQWAELLASLNDLELRIARRADELAREGVAPTELKLGCWLQAEQEILDGRLLENAIKSISPGAPAEI